MHPHSRRIIMPDGHSLWIAINSYGQIIEPVKDYLLYLRNIGRSPNTIRNYAGHLSKFWEYLEHLGLCWQRLDLPVLAEYMAWLRYPYLETTPIAPREALRAESTVNKMVGVVYNFYEFQARSGQVSFLNGYSYRQMPRRSYKPFLHHLSKGKPVRARLIKLKEPKRYSKSLDRETVKQILAACKNARDLFLVSLLYETGMRIGQALGLRISDIQSWDNKVLIIPRNDNANGARAKTRQEYAVHVSSDLMSLYGRYLAEDYPSTVDSDYVFVNIWSGCPGDPMTYASATSLLNTLRKRTKISFHWHMFRHTHATELLQDDWNMALVQKRLGHQSVQTTIDTYAHVNEKTLRNAHEEFIKKWHQ